MNLHEKALEIVTRYKKTEAELLEILDQIDRKKIFLQMGYGSLFDYSVKALGLTEGTAYNFVNVMRKARKVPELRVAIASGELTISKARKISSILTSENQAEWINAAKALSQKAIEHKVATAFPSQARSERSKYISKERLEIKLSISEALFKKIKRIQDLESKRQKCAVNWEETVEALANLYLEKKDPVRKAERVLVKKEKSVQQFSRIVSRTIPAHILHQVNTRDKGQCQICGNTRWTEVHHKLEWSRGGKHNLENLVTLCSAHHKFLHAS
jgi:hypothetical protein